MTPVPAPRRHRPLLRLAQMLVLAAAVWAAGLAWFAADIPREAPGDPRHTDAIVVLTGGSERLATGVDLLKRGLADKLFISGVPPGLTAADVLHAAHLRAGAETCCIVLGHAASDTIGNADETANWIRTEGFHSLRLVTSNYHMRRSLLEFRMALPGVTIVPQPVVPPTVHLKAWWRWPGTASLIVTEYTKYLLARTRLWIGESITR